MDTSASLPELQQLAIAPIVDEPGALFVAAGFEDRALAGLEWIRDNGVTLKSTYPINYLPKNRRNREEDVDSLANRISRQVDWIPYDRFSPEPFVANLRATVRNISPDEDIVIDISAMSSLLIIILLDALKNHSGAVRIIYTIPEVYYPTQAQFNSDMSQKRDNITMPPAFLTSDISQLITVSTLAGVSMQGAPLCVIAFPTFNPNDMLALVNELTPHTLVAIFGDPPGAQESWRNIAIKRLNNWVERYVDFKHFASCSTFSYPDTFRALCDAYEAHENSHRILLAPTGSKLQAVGCTLFKWAHPDVQLIYPVPRTYSEQFTEGIREIWSIRFSSFASTFKQLKASRWKGLDRLLNE